MWKMIGFQMSGFKGMSHNLITVILKSLTTPMDINSIRITIYVGMQPIM